MCCVENELFWIELNWPQLIESIWDMEYPAGNLYIKEAVEGIIEMFESYGRVDANKVVVLIVDGKASSVDGMEKVLAKAKEAGLNFYIIGK